MKKIGSSDNPDYKALKKLCQSGRERRKTGRIVLDGLHLIESYAKSFSSPVILVVSEIGFLRPEIADFIRKNAENNTLWLLSDSLYSELATVETPSGVMAIAERPLSSQSPRSDTDALLLDGVQDPGNLGAILRTAAAAGFSQVLLSADCAQVWSPKTLRAAMGAHFFLDIHESCDLISFLAGYCGTSLVTALDAEVSYLDLILSGPVAWVFGNEGQGVRPEVAALAKQKVRIPMPGATESLNVGAAAAICLFETVRQRQ